MTGLANVRVDLWLWRARVFKTRALAARFVEEGRVRRTHGGAEQRLEKASRCVSAGDVLVFALGGRVRELTVAALGERRGPASEARALYAEATGALTAAAADPHEAAPRSAPVLPDADSHAR